MGIMDKVNGASRNLNEKAKNISEINNLKSKIAYEEERIVEICTEIGKLYYKNPNGDFSQLDVLCTDIDTRRRRIKSMKSDMNFLRGYKVCPKCEAEVDDKFQFCGVCGSRITDDIEEDDFFSQPEENAYFSSNSGSLKASPQV
jgi:hypothetical protein